MRASFAMTRGTAFIWGFVAGPRGRPLLADQLVQILEQLVTVVGVDLHLDGRGAVEAAHPQQGFGVHLIAPLSKQYRVGVAVCDVDQSTHMLGPMQRDVYGSHKLTSRLADMDRERGHVKRCLVIQHAEGISPRVILLSYYTLFYNEKQELTAN